MPKVEPNPIIGFRNKTYHLSIFFGKIYAIADRASAESGILRFFLMYRSFPGKKPRKWFQNVRKVYEMKLKFEIGK